MPFSHDANGFASVQAIPIVRRRTPWQQAQGFYRLPRAASRKAARQCASCFSWRLLIHITSRLADLQDGEECRVKVASVSVSGNDIQYEPSSVFLIYTVLWTAGAASSASQA